MFLSQQLRLQLTKVCKKHYCEKKLTIMYCNSDNIQRMYACQIIEITATFPNNLICLHYIDLISEKKTKTIRVKCRPTNSRACHSHNEHRLRIVAVQFSVQSVNQANSHTMRPDRAPRGSYRGRAPPK